MQIKLKFGIDRETKGAVRYQELDDDGHAETVHHTIGTLYVRKAALPRGKAWPNELAITIDTPED